MRKPRAHLSVVWGLLVASTLIAGRGATGSELPRVQEEVPVTAVDLRAEPAYNSPALAADPTEPRFVVAASRLDNPFGCALDISGDSGRSWLPVAPVPQLPPGADRCYAPEVAFDPSGTLHYLFIGLHGLGNAPIGVFLTESTDRGQTFSHPHQVLGAERYMVRMAIDPDRGGQGRMHLVWLEATTAPPLGGLGPPPNPIMAAYSDDGGRAFSHPVQVSDRERQRVVAPALALGPDDSLHVLYYDLRRDVVDYQGLEGPTWDGTWSLVMASSRDGGEHFERGVEVDNDIVPNQRVMLIYTMPPASLASDGSDQLVAAWTDARNGDWDVLARRSPDGGRTWEAVTRLNDDRVGNGRHQYMPRVSAAPTGRFDVIFYDRRNDPSNVRNDVYYTFSDDGGRSFAANVRVTSESFDSRRGTRYPIPSAVGQHEFGSRIALLSRESDLVAAWADTRNNRIGVAQDIFATQVDLPAQHGTHGWVLTVIGGVVAAVASGMVIVVRRRRRRRSPGGIAVRDATSRHQ